MTSTRKKKPAVPKQKVFLVDDHPLVREHLRVLINQQPDLVVCGEAGDAPQALSAMPAAKPDVVVVDLSLPESHGLELIRDLKRHRPRLPLLVLSMHEDALHATRALRAGATGYVAKRSATQSILTGLRQVLAGQNYLCEHVSSRLTADYTARLATPGDTPADRLSARELEVFELIGQGHSTRQVAVRLHLGISTIETYRERLKTKLRLASGAELARAAVRWIESNRLP